MKSSPNLHAFILSFSLLLPPALTYAAQKEPLFDLNSNPQPDFIIDLSKPQSGEQVSVKQGSLNIKILNMIPSQRSNYLVTVSQSVYVVSPLNIATAPTISPAARAAFAGAPGNCQGLSQLLETLEAADKSLEVADLRTKINSTYSSIAANDDTCNEVIARINFILKMTTDSVTATINDSVDAKISVALSSSSAVISSLAIKPIRKEWISSYGFGFVKNEDEQYYSSGNSQTGFVLAKQNDRDEFSYSALLLFTYPIHTFGDSAIDFGLTGGIGATEENISALLGVSFIVSKNFIITGGATFQEFDVLKGQYSEGESIGTVPLDSTALHDKTFKPAGTIVLSYRFGASGS